MKRQVFLTAAERVLKEMGHPMDATDIVNKAIMDGYIQSKGKTPENTMRARLSEDISNYKNNSRFKRVGANKFGLRNWHEIEYDKRIIKSRREKVICITQHNIDKTGRFFGFKFNYKDYLDAIKKNDLIEIDKESADNDVNLKQLVSYIILKDKYGKILCYRRGSYSTIKENFLQGLLCIGFGGHLIEKDLYPILDIDESIKNCAYREVKEELKGIIPQNLKFIGTINDDSSLLGLRNFAFVLEGELPADFNIEKSSVELSINQLCLLTESELWNKFHELEFWSQLLCKNIFGHKNKLNTPSIVIRGKKKKYFDNNPYIIVGEIGSGKSEVAKFLSGNFNMEYISSRDSIKEILNKEDFGKGSRTEFQNAALEMIANENGINSLTEKIVEKIKYVNNRKIILDGIRNVATLEKLKKIFPTLIVIYIEMSKDKAFELFKKNRDVTASIHDFRSERSHEVEREIPLFLSRTDIYIFNGGKLNQLYIELAKWWDINVKT